jgi:hypothetical protein
MKSRSGTGLTGTTGDVGSDCISALSKANVKSSLATSSPTLPLPMRPMFKNLTRSWTGSTLCMRVLAASASRGSEGVPDRMYSPCSGTECAILICFSISSLSVRRETSRAGSNSRRRRVDRIAILAVSLRSVPCRVGESRLSILIARME